MLDLKELERRLDDALEKETAESLTTWLNKQRAGTSLSEYLGVGNIENFQKNTLTFQQYVVGTSVYSWAGDNDPCDDLSSAA